LRISTLISLTVRLSVFRQLYFIRNARFRFINVCGVEQ
jgi:hypothetical protein